MPAKAHKQNPVFLHLTREHARALYTAINTRHPRHRHLIARELPISAWERMRRALSIALPDQSSFYITARDDKHGYNICVNIDDAKQLHALTGITLPALSAKSKTAAMANVTQATLQLSDEQKNTLRTNTQTRQSNAERNALGRALRDTSNPLGLAPKATATLAQCYNSARIGLTKKTHSILETYFNAARKQDDCMGHYYRSINFEQFVQRLMLARYRMVYLDGRTLVVNGNNPLSQALHAAYSKHGATQISRGIYMNANINRKLLLGIGQTEQAIQQQWHLYGLTLEETMLSGLTVPYSASPIIGTGDRSPERSWDPVKEYQQSIKAIATSLYPAACEFRRGTSLHSDNFMCAIPKAGYSKDERALLKRYKRNSALMQTAQIIYGKHTALNADRSNRDAFIDCSTHLIVKAAYKSKTKHMLTNVLLSADRAISESGLGSTLQLKGLGLGAFAFGRSGQLAMEAVFIECLQEVLDEVMLNSIKRINLINFPSTFAIGKTNYKPLKQTNKNSVALYQLNMNPTAATYPADAGADAGKPTHIGAVTVAGDSGSIPGNEGNLGVQRSSSDDPAWQYSLLFPHIMNPRHNPSLRDKQCITITNDHVADHTAAHSGAGAGAGAGAKAATSASWVDVMYKAVLMQDIVKISELLDAGFSINRKLNNDCNALDIAINLNDGLLIEYLKNCGAKPTAKPAAPSVDRVFSQPTKASHHKPAAEEEGRDWTFIPYN